MNDTRRTLDARGQACPQPVILTRKALAEGGFDLLEVIVDDASSRENVERFAAYANCTVEAVAEEGPVSRVLIRPGALPAPEARPAPAPEAPAATVLITSAGIGSGDEKLAALLMRGFLYTLTEGESTPARIILMNGGVRLAVEGSDALVNLRRLAGLEGGEQFRQSTISTDSGGPPLAPTMQASTPAARSAARASPATASGRAASRPPEVWGSKSTSRARAGTAPALRMKRRRARFRRAPSGTRPWAA